MRALRVEGGVVAAYFKDGVVKKLTVRKLGKAMNATDLMGATVIVPDGTVEIAEKAFDALYLRHVVLPRTLKVLNPFSFRANLNLLDVVVPPGCKIECGAFEDCIALTKVKLGPVATIGMRAFKGCIKLSEVCISNVVRICPYAFSGCTSLTQIALPDTVESIETHAFSNTHLASFIVPPRVRNVGRGAFERCQRLRVVDLKNVVTIDESAFAHTGLLSLSIPGTVEHISGNAFSHSSIKTIVFEPSNRPLRRIGTHAFFATPIREVSLPRRLANLGQGAFQKCSLLTEVTFHPQCDITGLSRLAFCNCPRLRAVTLNGAVECIGWGAFAMCASLETVNLAALSVLRGIDSEAFDGCSALRDVTLPASLRYIGSRAFNESGIHRIDTEGTSANKLVIHMDAFVNCEWLYTASFNFRAYEFFWVFNRVNAQFDGCTRLQMVLLPPPEFPYQTQARPAEWVTISPATLRAAARVHREWWRRMDLLPPESIRYVYYVLWILNQCRLPTVVAVTIVRLLRPYDLRWVHPTVRGRR
jgi:hypothetical protein